MSGCGALEAMTEDELMQAIERAAKEDLQSFRRGVDCACRPKLESEAGLLQVHPLVSERNLYHPPKSS